MFLITHPVYAINVVFVDPSYKGDIFWTVVTKVASTAAEDLDINFEVMNSAGNRYAQAQVINQLISREKKTDYVIFIAEDGQALGSFTSLEQAGISFVTIERVVFPDLAYQIGSPREKFKYWLGEVYHDNKKAGQQLANSLFQASKQSNNTDEIVEVVGITGDYSGHSSERSAGLVSEITNEKKYSLAQIVHGKWRRKIAGNMFEGLNHRYKHIGIVWTAADEMALGVSNVAQRLGKTINQDIFIGGFDWSQEAILAIDENRLSASVGGHFMQVAWALVKIFDYHRGLDVFPTGGGKPTYELQVIDRTNVKQYEILLNEPDWKKVDFSDFSLFSNKQNQSKGYDFSFDKVIKQLH